MLKVMNRGHSTFAAILLVLALQAPRDTLWAAMPELVDLRSAARFVLLAGTAITSTGGGTLQGDLGTSPITGAAITGLTTAQVAGIIYTVDGTGPTGSVMDPDLLALAKADLALAYLDAEGRAPATPILGGALAGTWLPGLYKDNGTPASLGLTGTMVLDAQGDPDAVWIFQSGSTLITEIDSRIILTNGAQSRHVFWLVRSSATLKGGSVFKGTILALTAITLDAGAALKGRALAQNTAITFNGNLAGLPAPEAPAFTDIHRVPGDATRVSLTTTPYFHLSLQTSSNLLRTNWTTIAVDIPTADIWSYTDTTATAQETLRFYRAVITH